MINQETGKIICTKFDQGKNHDFKIFKESKLALKKDLRCLGDKGYQGLEKYHKNSSTPKKKPRKGYLTREDKQNNREQARLRVIVEHVNRRLKIFRILSERYRNRRKRFGLRFNLIAGLYNHELMTINKLSS